jgi:hypothetical protein
LASIVGLLSFLEYWHGWNLGIDQLLFVAGTQDALGSVRPGLMSPITALGFLFLGASLVLLDSKTLRGRRLAQFLAVAAAVVCTFGILDFVLDYNTGHTYIALPTAILLFLLSFALIFARMDMGLGRLVASSSMGGTISRRLLPAAIVVPMVIGWLRTQGQAIGLGWDRDHDRKRGHSAGRHHRLDGLHHRPDRFEEAGSARVCAAHGFHCDLFE